MRKNNPSAAVPTGNLFVKAIRGTPGSPKQGMDMTVFACHCNFDFPI